MLGADYALLFAIATAAFAAIGLAWRSRRPEERVLYLLSLGVYIVGLLAFLRLSGAKGSEEAEAACRFLYLIIALGTAPWVLLATIAQGTQRWAFLQARGIFLGFFVLIGFALATLTQSDLLFNEIERLDGYTVISLGVAGKLVLVYLTAAAAYILTQVETLLRAARRLSGRGSWILLGIIGISVIVYVYIATETFLYGRLDTRQLAMATIPASLACLTTGIASLRRSFDDMRFPVARGVVYSSFTLFLIGLLMVLLGLFSRVTDIIGVSVDRAFLLATSFVAVVVGFAIWISPTWKRRVAQFIDENFYVNRYDYRKEWEHVARRVQPVLERADTVKNVCEAVHAIFDASSVHLAVLNSATENYTVYDAGGRLVSRFSPRAGGELAALLESRKEPITLSDVTNDLDVIPAFVEHREDLEKLGISTLVPMVSRSRLVGFLLLAAPHQGGMFTPEDLGLMTLIGADLANSLRAHLLMREAEDRREGEALVRLSSFVLHDLKNCVSSLRGALEGAETYMDRPDFRKDLIVTLSSTADRMTSMMNRLGDVKPLPERGTRASAECHVTAVVEDAMKQVKPAQTDGVEWVVELPEDLKTDGSFEMLERVFVNLLMNALEALSNGGTVRVSGDRIEDRGRMWNRIRVEDTGCGMSPEFIAESLFRPFTSTKGKGLGIGLFQCKSIIEDHDGSLAVTSEPQKGTTVEVRLPVANGGEDS